jgi:N-acetylneuraminate lyase
MGAAKATMQMLGIDVGPARLPNTSLTPEQADKLRGELEALGYFNWL